MAGLHRRRAGGAADRRDRQGRHRVPERPAARDSTAWSSTSTRRARLVQAKHRPLVFITSNNEKELPDAFLRRCFFHYIKFPDADTMQPIVDVHFPNLKKELLAAALKTFYDVRNLPGLKKKPSHLRTARLAQAAGGRRHPARGAAQQGRQGRGAAAGGRAAEERAGRDTCSRTWSSCSGTTAEPRLAPAPWPSPNPSPCDGRGVRAGAAGARASRRPATPPPRRRAVEALVHLGAGARATSAPRSTPRWPCATPATCCPSPCVDAASGTHRRHDAATMTSCRPSTRVEIGYTWYAQARAAQRTSTPSASCCCCGHAFDTLGCIAVGCAPTLQLRSASAPSSAWAPRRTACCATTRCAATARCATP